MVSRRAEAEEQIEVRFRLACLEPRPPLAPLVARYMSRLDLLQLLRLITDMVRGKLGLAATSMPSLSSTVGRLSKLQLLRVVGKPTRHGKPPFWLTLRGGSPSEPNPYELLASLDRRGVVSHLSALSFHGLTDLRPRAHYLTVPRRPSPRGRAPQGTDGHPPAPTRKPAPRVGTPRFTLRGVSFRTKDLVDSHVFGFRKEPTDERESVLVFDVERSLLNTLTDPACNGGARGVIQAWENAADRLQPDRLLDYLRRLDRPALWRRVGALATAFGLSDLAGTVGELVAELPRLDEPLPLIWNQRAGTVLAPWSVIVPW